MMKKKGLLALLVCSALITACTEMCSNEMKAEFISPDSSKKLVVFMRNCGATTGFSTQASVLEANETMPNKKGNILILKGIIEIRGNWQSENQLTVLGVGSSEVFKRESQIGEVAVTYSE